MIQIISGTDRPESRSFEISKISQNLFKIHGSESNIINLCGLGLNELNGQQYGGALNESSSVGNAVQLVNQASGLLFVVPEYNGSFPGALKYFIDHWSYPDSFESRPVAFIGLGGQWGGLRSVEHLQGVFGYRNSYIFPERVFLTNIWEKLKDGLISDALCNELLEKQAENFIKFIRALRSESLSC
ncbi:MAG: NAD(P)H-dependent oxidoreductase [Bdellovibrionaceae bacterium]|jgi:chromate reductase, NAD(P)H dehydrogenase (quinone)|nr:NAD(P)H-dependent oxidoreductase [Pseudobdellovibrionaceae bacterium]